MNLAQAVSGSQKHEVSMSYFTLDIFIILSPFKVRQDRMRAELQQKIQLREHKMDKVNSSVKAYKVLLYMLLRAHGLIVILTWGNLPSLLSGQLRCWVAGDQQRFLSGDEDCGGRSAESPSTPGGKVVAFHITSSTKNATCVLRMYSHSWEPVD